MKKPQLTVSVALLLLANAASGELVRDGVWQVRQGESLSAILDKAFPNQPLRQSRIERLSRRLSPSAFDTAGDLVVGQELRLPGARMPRQASRRQSGAGRQVAKVVVVSGNGSATGDDGRARPLERGAPVYKGDTLSTERARAQVRFSDGSLVSLRPNTQFKVEEYQYDGEEGEEERGLFNLIKGGFRTISGAIGKLNRDNYEVKTAVATIGIRGTHYGVTICDPCQDGDEERRGLFGGVVDGEIVVKNDQGEFTFGNDEYFHLPDGGGKPRGLIAPPGFVFGDQGDDAEEGSSEDGLPGSGDTAEGTESAGGEGEGQSGYSDPEADERAAESNRTVPGGEFESDKDDTGFNSQRDDDLVTELEGLKETGDLPDQLDLTGEQEEVAQTDPFPQPVGELITPTQSAQVGFISLGNNLAGTPSGATESWSGESAYITPRPTPGPGGFDLTSVDFVNENGERFVYRKQDGAPLVDAGYDADFGVSWGRWSEATLQAVDTVNTPDTIETAPIVTDLHFMLAESPIQNIQDFESQLDLMGYTLQTAPTTLTMFEHNSGTASTAPVDLAGNEGAVSAAMMSIDLVNYDITQLTVNADFGTHGYILALDGGSPLVNVSDIVNGSVSSIDMAGDYCADGISTCTNSEALNGQASVALIAVPGSAAYPEGAMGAAVTYAGRGTVNPGDIGVAGAVLLSAQGSTGW
ncbi:MAG: FecR family protein [Pseudomonadota bacterium]